MSKFGEVAILTAEEIFSSFSTSKLGLTHEEVVRRQGRDGLNVIRTHTISWFSVLLRQFKSPFIYLLFGAALVSFFLGEARDALFIFLFITINAFLGFYQEFKSESAVALLSKYVEATVHIFREGRHLRCRSSELVVGDIVELSAGDIVQADIRLTDVEGFSVDESILTGESEPQSKDFLQQKSAPSQIYDASNIVFSGTTVVTGRAMGVVFAIAHEKVVSGIVKLTTDSIRVSSFEKGVSKFSKFILKTIAITLVLMVLANVLVKGSSVNFPELLLFAVALAVSVIPEALPVVTTFSLSQGALKLARQKVVVKRLSSIEDLGSISVLCTDKTGTITENRLTHVKSLAYKSSDIHSFAALSCDFLEKEKAHIDAFDKAILSNGKGDTHGFIVINKLPFDPTRRRSTQLLQKGKEYFLVTRGAPETVMSLCGKLQNNTEIEKWIQKEGFRGNRVLAVASKKYNKKPVQSLKKLELDMEFTGLVSFNDPLKPTTMEAMQKARKLGVSIKVITGDRAEVAGAVGVAIGLIDNVADVLTGEAYLDLSEEEKDKAVVGKHIFARATPEVKYDIIKRLQKWSEVGFLGEGINDAPALKVANVGIVVQSASDISRDAADIILLNKSLITVIEGIGEGRVVFANTVKYIKATLTSNFGNFYAIAVSSLLIPFLPLLPIQILLVNLLSDFPMISIAADNVDPEELTSPRGYEIKDVAITAIILGAVSTIFDFITFALFVKRGEHVLQTNWFVVSILTELILIYSIRTKRPFWKSRPPALAITLLTGVAAIITMVLPQIELGRKYFTFQSPSLHTIIEILIMVLTYFVCTEVAKLALNKYKSNKLRVHALTS